MSVQVPFTLDGQVLKLVLRASVYEVDPSHPRFADIKREMLAGKGEDELLALVQAEAPASVESVLRNLSEGKVEIQDGVVTYDGIKVSNALTDFILRLQSEGLPMTGAVRFMEKLYRNVSLRVREQLFNFMQTCGGFTITDDGCFLAYKAVRQDYKDKYRGIFDNSPGAVPKMDRKDVDDDANEGCSKGLHAGSLDYVAIYGRGDDRIVIVKIDPENVVCVPKDHSWKKIRVCEYTVIGDFQGELKKGCYSASKSVPDMYAEDEEDENDDWEEFEDYDDEEDEYYDLDEEEDDEEWDDEEDSDVLDGDDDQYDEGQVTVGRDERYARPQDAPTPPPAPQAKDSDLGKKPNGWRFWNRRDGSGRFTKKN